MRRPLLVWATSIGGLVALDVWCAYNETEGDSLSEHLRRLPPPVFVGGWLALSAWVIPHILRGPTPHVPPWRQNRPL